MRVRTEPVDKKLDIQYFVAVPIQMVLLRDETDLCFDVIVSGEKKFHRGNICLLKKIERVCRWCMY